MNFLPSSEITECYDHPIGVADTAKIPDAQITASSEHGDKYKAAFGRLNGNRGDGWCSKSASSNNEWLQVDLGKSYSVCAVATQGDRNGNEWVTKFKLLFSWDGTSWHVYQGDSGKDVVRTMQLRYFLYLIVGKLIKNALAILCPWRQNSILLRSLICTPEKKQNKCLSSIHSLQLLVHIYFKIIKFTQN